MTRNKSSFFSPIFIANSLPTRPLRKSTCSRRPWWARRPAESASASESGPCPAQNTFQGSSATTTRRPTQKTTWPRAGSKSAHTNWSTNTDSCQRAAARRQLPRQLRQLLSRRQAAARLRMRSCRWQELSCGKRLMFTSKFFFVFSQI